MTSGRCSTRCRRPGGGRLALQRRRGDACSSGARRRRLRATPSTGWRRCRPCTGMTPGGTSMPVPPGPRLRIGSITTASRIREPFWRRSDDFGRARGPWPHAAAERPAGSPPVPHNLDTAAVYGGALPRGLLRRAGARAGIPAGSGRLRRNVLRVSRETQGSATSICEPRPLDCFAGLVITEALKPRARMSAPRRAGTRAPRIPTSQPPIRANPPDGAPSGRADAGATCAQRGRRRTGSARGPAAAATRARPSRARPAGPKPTSASMAGAWNSRNCAAVFSESAPGTCAAAALSATPSSPARQASAASARPRRSLHAPRSTRAWRWPPATPARRDRPGSR